MDKILEDVNHLVICMNRLCKEHDSITERVHQFVIQVQEAIKAIELRETWPRSTEMEYGFGKGLEYALNELNKALGDKSVPD